MQTCNFDSLIKKFSFFLETFVMIFIIKSFGLKEKEVIQWNKSPTNNTLSISFLTRILSPLYPSSTRILTIIYPSLKSPISSHRNSKKWIKIHFHTFRNSKCPNSAASSLNSSSKRSKKQDRESNRDRNPKQITKRKKRPILSFPRKLLSRTSPRYPKTSRRVLWLSKLNKVRNFSLSQEPEYGALQEIRSTCSKRDDWSAVEREGQHLIGYSSWEGGNIGFKQEQEIRGDWDLPKRIRYWWAY